MYFVKPEDFHAILNDFEDFDQFVRTRAIRRRAYVRYLELEIISEIRKSDNSCLEISVDLEDDDKSDFSD